MALTTCSECKREISELATVCPGCGVPIEKNINKRTRVTIQKAITTLLPLAVMIFVFYFLERYSKAIFRFI